MHDETYQNAPPGDSSKATPAIVQTPGLELFVESREKDAAAQLATFRSFRILSDDEDELAQAAIVEIAGRIKAAEEERLSITRPMDQAKTRVMEIFRRITNPLGEARTILETAHFEYLKRKRAETERLERERRAAIAQAETLIENPTVENVAKAAALVETAAAVPAPTAAPRVAGASARKRWTYEITDEDAVPRSLCSPDTKKIQAFVDLHKAKAVAGGIRFYEKEGLAATPGRRR